MLVFRQLVCVVHGSMTDLLLLYSVGCRRRGWFVRVGKFFNGMKFCFEKKKIPNFVWCCLVLVYDLFFIMYTDFISWSSQADHMLPSCHHLWLFGCVQKVQMIEDVFEKRQRLLALAFDILHDQCH